MLIEPDNSHSTGGVHRPIAESAELALSTDTTWSLPIPLRCYASSAAPGSSPTAPDNVILRLRAAL